jgi:hypothetical protein
MFQEKFEKRELMVVWERTTRSFNGEREHFMGLYRSEYTTNKTLNLLLCFKKFGTLRY